MPRDARHSECLAPPHPSRGYHVDFGASVGETFGMPVQFAGSDLLLTQLLAGDVGGAQAAWPSRWKGTDESTGWTTRLIVGRLATAHAEIALHAESAESAVEWARRAIEIARGTRRRKDEARALTLL